MQVNSICNRFERAWQTGQAPSIEAIAAGADSLVRPALLQHLAELDIQCRVSRGSAVDLELYFTRWPDLDRKTLQDALEAAQKNSQTSLLIVAMVASTTPAKSPPQTCTVEEFLTRLRDSRLLSDSEMNSLAGSVAGEQSSSAIGAKLLDARKLTSFQVTALLEGSGEPLVLGEYVVQELVGRGGMGTVYRAVHRRMKRTVALKVLRRDIPHAEILAKRFLREVEVAARLCHPNVVTAYDAGEQNGMSFLVSEFVEGQNLGDLVKEYGPLSLPLAIDVILQAARALEYAHGEGVIHRDIKPSNLLLDDSGNVKLLDVGLARINQPELSESDDSSELTTTGMIMGTVDYMSPEQAQNTRLADERSDIYSLGCTLFFLITGRAPYARGTAMERLLAHREQPIPSAQMLSAELPPELDDILRLLLAKKPLDRISTMQLVAEKLESMKSAGLPDVTLSLMTQDEEPAISQTMDSPIAATQQVSEIIASTFQGDTVVGQLNDDASLAPGMLNSDSVAEFRPSETESGSETRRAVSSASSFLPWVVIPGLLAVVVAAILLRPDNTAVTPPTLAGDRSPLEELSALSESEVQAYRTRWASELKHDEEQTVNGVVFVLIPPGEFLYGDESDSVITTIANEYWLSEVEVTVGQFRAFVESSNNYKTVAESKGTGWGKVGPDWVQSAGYCWKNLGENFVNDSTPACSIAYPDALAYCDWMSTTSGRNVRLPTEEEWEYACRCGRRGAWSFGNDVSLLDQYAWTQQNSGREIHSVRGLLPNAWGLFDMHGNEYEWCSEPTAVSPNFAGTGPVRGGSFAGTPDQCRSGARHRTPLGEPTQGAFRVLMERK